MSALHRRLSVNLRRRVREADAAIAAAIATVSARKRKPAANTKRKGRKV